MNYSVQPRENLLAQFDNLSKRMSNNTHKRRIPVHEQPEISPREEIYKSMIREIKNGDASQMNSLVHKASGILRLSHYKELHKNRKMTISWDMNGRRVMKFDGKSGDEESLLHRQTGFHRDSKKNLLNALNEPIFGLHSDSLKTLSEHIDTDKNLKPYGATDGELSQVKVSKVWEDYIDTGDVSKLWQSKEGVISVESRSALDKHLPGATTAEASLSLCRNVEAYPPWKTFYRAPSASTLISEQDPASLPVVQNRREQHKRSSCTHGKTSTTAKIQSNISILEEVEHIQHICIVNGSVVTFKNFGFENFTNWFGDEAALEANQRRRQPKLHHEIDLTDVKSRDIKIRLLDGCKLEVDARRRISSTRKPVRVKEILPIPTRYKPEDLLICRTKSGKLVVEEITPESAITNKRSSKMKSSKSKAKWKTGK